MEARHQAAENTAVAALLCHVAFWFGLLCATPAFIALNNPEDVVFGVGTLLAWTGGICILLSFLGWKAASLAGERPGWWVNRGLLAAPTCPCPLAWEIRHASDQTRLYPR